MRTGSPRNAFFKGQASREQAWFTLSDSIPGLSMGAERAGRRIVAAARRGSPELVLALPAKIGVRVHGVLPGTTVQLSGWSTGCCRARGRTTRPPSVAPTSTWRTVRRCSGRPPL
jgi:hypothetical protein